MALIFLFVGLFLPLSTAEFSVRLLTEDDGFLTGQFPDSLLLNLPPCSFKGQGVNLKVVNTVTNATRRITGAFTVPQCQGEGTTVTMKNGLVAAGPYLGYRVANLTSSTKYRLQYQIGSNESNILIAETTKVSAYSEIDTSLPARSGAMVVITVILSVAIFILLVCLIVTIALSQDKD